MAYDYVSEALARYFLTARLHEMTGATGVEQPTEEDIRAMAEHVQTSAEDWLAMNPVKKKAKAVTQ